MFTIGKSISRAQAKSENAYVWAVMEACTSEKAVCTYTLTSGEKYLHSFQLISPKRKIGANAALFIESAISKLDSKNTITESGHRGILLLEQNTKVYCQYIQMSDGVTITVHFNTVVNAEIVNITFTVQK